MRKISAIMTFFVFFLMSGTASASYEISGRWLLDGGGHAEKGILRVALNVDGYMDFHTETKDNNEYITGHTLKVKLNASKLGINAWEKSATEVWDTPILVPELDPTLNDPFELPSVKQDGLTYKVTFTTTTSGTVKIYGTTNVDGVGNVDIDSESAIWKEGTEKPKIEDKTSGCESQNYGLLGLGTLFSFLFLRVFVKKGMPQ